MSFELSIEAEIERYRSDLCKAGYRGMVVIAGERKWCSEIARLAVQMDGDSLWIGNRLDEELNNISARDCFQHLGREHSDVVFDSWQGLDPDALGAISGTLRAGSILFILTPTFETWESYDDPEYKRIIVEPYESQDAGRRFIKHVCKVLTSSNNIQIIRQAEEVQFRNISVTIDNAKQYVDAPYKSLEQKSAVAAVARVVNGHRRRPLLIVADRGRGKSSALGLAAANYMATTAGKIGVTAPGKNQVNEIFARIKELHPKSIQHGMKLVHGDSVIEFYAPDELLRSLPKLNLLLVDEAAAIPIHMLEKMLHKYSRLVYATTVHGYEGTGNGFEIKFTKILNEHCEKWNSIHMLEPIRWNVDDILERITSEILLLDAENDNGSIEFEDDAIEIAQIERSRLIESDDDLYDWFGLLVNAHYKTRPYDLRQMLDGPNMRIWNVSVKNKIIATAVVAMEGLIVSDEAADDIFQGRRRLHGHLMPQTLVMHSGHKEALNYKYLRVVRIAVHDEYRRRGIGRKLISAIEKWAEQNNKDYLAVSFSADTEVIGFWLDCGFEAVRIGLKKESSTGQHNIMMMRSINDRSEEYLETVITKYIEDLPYLLAEPLNELNASIIVSLAANECRTNIADDIRKHILDFCAGNRLYESVIRELSLLLSASLHSEKDINAGMVLNAQKFLIEKVWQKRDIEFFKYEYGIKGKAELLSELKIAARTALLKYA